MVRSLLIKPFIVALVNIQTSLTLICLLKVYEAGDFQRIFSVWFGFEVVLYPKLGYSYTMAREFVKNCGSHQGTHGQEDYLKSDKLCLPLDPILCQGHPDWNMESSNNLLDPITHDDGQCTCKVYKI